MSNQHGDNPGSKLMSYLPGMAYRCLNDETWTMLEISEGVEALTGYPPETFLGKDAMSFAELIHPEDQQHTWDEVQKGLALEGSFDLEYRIVLPGGLIKRVWEHGRGVYANGELVELSGFVTDLTTKMKRQKRYTESQEAMVRLASSEHMALGKLQALSEQLTMEASKLLGVQRASVWLLSDDKSSLHLVTLYDKSTGGHSTDNVLHASEYPNYFAALVNNRAIAAVDAATDPATSEFQSGYLQATGVVSMLDASVRLGGEVIGVVCNEQVGPQRRWLPEEVSLAGELADQVAHVVANQQRIEIEQRIRDTEAADKAKSQLLATISHELRTPMNGVLGIAELLATTELDARQKQYLETIRDSGKLLLTIINDVLDYSKLDAGKLALFDSETNVPGLFADMVSVLGQSTAPGVKLRLTEGGGFPASVMLDNHRLRQLLFNLIGNAIKFTHEGEVSVYYTTLPGNRWYFEVKDTGIGISEEQLPLIFEPFGQLIDSPRSASAEGTGLGLAICRALVEHMGGEISASSEPGVGSCFSVNLPLVLTPGAAEASGPVQDDDAKYFPDLRVLVAEDNEVNQQVITGLLSRFGVKPDVCDNGAEAIECFREAPNYDLILMDCDMPLVDGFTATREILKLHGPESAPTVAALSAHALDEFKARAEQSGMQYYLTKPVRLKELGDLLKKVQVEVAEL